MEVRIPHNNKYKDVSHREYTHRANFKWNSLNAYSILIFSISGHFSPKPVELIFYLFYTLKIAKLGFFYYRPILTSFDRHLNYWTEL